jgi:O-antigen/teichoic acid export membrane protein
MIRNIFTNFSVRLIGAVFNLIVMLITTHKLGADLRGEIVIIALAVNIIHLVSDIAGGPALVFLVPRAKIPILLLTGGAWALFSCFGMGYLLFEFHLLPGSKAMHVNFEEVLLLSLLLSFSSLNQNILLGQERIKECNFIVFLMGALQLSGIFFSIFVLHIQSSQAYINACFLSYGICFIVGFIFVMNKKHDPKLIETRPILYVLFANGFYTQMASIAFQLSIRENFDRLTKLNPGNNVPVGLYSTAIALGEAILIFSGSVAAITMARIANANEPEKAREAALRMSKLSVCITVPAILIFMLLPSEFFSALIGKEFGPVKNIFFSLFPGIAVISFSTVYSFYFAGIGKHYMNFFSGIFGFIITLVTAGPLINSFGVVGAGWSATSAYCGLGIFIFLMFMFVGGNKKSDWKLLLPSMDDVKWIKTNLKKILPGEK